MNSVARTITMLATLDLLASIASYMADSKPPWWRWTCYLAAAVSARKNGVA